VIGQFKNRHREQCDNEKERPDRIQLGLSTQLTDQPAKHKPYPRRETSAGISGESSGAFCIWAGRGIYFASKGDHNASRRSAGEKSRRQTNRSKAASLAALYMTRFY
jgi:hypothetical protein